MSQTVWTINMSKRNGSIMLLPTVTRQRRPTIAKCKSLLRFLDCKRSSSVFWSCTYFLSGQIQSPSLTRKLFPDILGATSKAADCSSLALELLSLPRSVRTMHVAHAQACPPYWSLGYGNTTRTIPVTIALYVQNVNVKIELSIKSF